MKIPLVGQAEAPGPDLGEALRSFDWSTWKLDWGTIGWIFWIVFFVVWETLTLLAKDNQELTEHLRPVFLFAPVTWFMALGAWLWLGIHLLWPALELYIQGRVGKL
jgi:hypothetical protein